MVRINPKWEQAVFIAEEMGNGTSANIKRILRELKEVRAEGYDEEDAIECWRWLRTREDFPIEQARISTVLKGSPEYIKQWERFVWDNMPPMWETSLYDDYVRQNAKFLKKHGFVYRWPTIESQTDNSRMTYEEAKGLGLAE